MARTSSVYARVEPEVKEQFDIEIAKGIKSMEKGKVYSAEEVEAQMLRDFGV